ncbi:hypothetical protein BV22DRAFT_38326 [Leucogyrophana mollusca]|uniref:Uncharacterized protein n=1 Tax=Leucogyrophana mollusca TaxID=85980 RepID=A0ACB8BYU4_9AGAM|nr:hypothetical protein BV22DRAFT_38326 [Leucogyrophana mollusca]
MYVCGVECYMLSGGFRSHIESLYTLEENTGPAKCVQLRLMTTRGWITGQRSVHPRHRTQDFMALEESRVRIWPNLPTINLRVALAAQMGCRTAQGL